MRVPSFHAFRAGRVSVAPPAPAALANLWSWGGNNSGQLGLGNLTNRSSPVQVGTLNNWAEVFGGTMCSFATKTDGTLWAWGQALVGKLGLGDVYVNRSSPVQVGALTDWTGAKISSRDLYTLAVKSNGTLWAWGNNFFGTLGLGHNTRRSSPVQVGALTNWAEVSVGQAAVLAVKTDGTLWSWGYNSTKGVLGLGDTINRSSPVQVGVLTDWSKLSVNSDSTYCFNHNTALIKTNGTLWAWGANIDGEHANGVTSVVRRSAPVQLLSGISDWNSVSVIAGSYNGGAMLALRTA